MNQGRKPEAPADASLGEGLDVALEYRAGSLRLHARFTAGQDQSGSPELRLALFGPSGSGKTTLLRILAGLVQPERGRVTLDGRVLVDTAQGISLPVGSRNIGFVTQSPALFPHLSVAANLRYGLRRSGPKTEARLREITALLGLDARTDAGSGDLTERYPRHLSGGERQRVALARALALQPRLLLLDEPFSALDIAGKAALWKALTPWLQTRGIATLLVSHDAGEVWAYAQTVIRMRDGIATEHGPAAAMLAVERDQVLGQLGAR